MFERWKCRSGWSINGVHIRYPRSSAVRRAVRALFVTGVLIYMYGICRSSIPSAAVDEVDGSLFQGDETYELRMQRLRTTLSQTVEHLLNLTLPNFVELVTARLDVDHDVRLGLLLELLVLMEDYVEHQFAFLSSQAATVIHECALRVFMGKCVERVFLHPVH